MNTMGQLQGSCGAHGVAARQQADRLEQATLGALQVILAGVAEVWWATDQGAWDDDVTVEPAVVYAAPVGDRPAGQDGVTDVSRVWTFQSWHLAAAYIAEEADWLRGQVTGQV